MSDKHQPTLADILEAVERQGTRLTALDAGLARQNSRLTALDARLTRQDEKLTDLRVAAMDRIDRLQNTMDRVRDDQGVLFGLLATNQRQAEKNPAEARFASDLHSSLAQTMTLIEMQVRKLQADVEEIRGRLH